MKVNIYETVEISDDQRVDIARHLDGPGQKKRQATRDEIKAYVWERGLGWSDQLVDDRAGPDPEPDGDPDQLALDDLI